jgi:beta-lactamase class A
MPPSRRTLLTTTLASAVLGAAGCGGRADRASAAVHRGLDFGRLEHGFAPLAAAAAPAVFDLGVMTFDGPTVWCADRSRRFPAQGLVAGPVAAAALAEVDAGRLKLNDRIRIRAVDLSPPPSRINRAFQPGGDDIELPAADLIALAVHDGDNTALDAIMAHIGGPGAVTAWLRGRDIKEMRIDRYQREVLTDLFGLASFRAAWKHDDAWAAARAAISPQLRESARAAWLADPRDTTSAEAALNFLNQLAGGRLLLPGSARFLLRLMSAEANGMRLAAGLPAGSTLARQGGSTPTDLGLTAADNDMGLVSLPDGRRFAIATFLAGSTATARQRDALIAEAAHMAVSALR